MEVVLNVASYFDNLVSKRVWSKTQAVSVVIPYIIEDMFPEMSILYLDNSGICLQDMQKYRWKVSVSRDDTFDIAPSYTKGCKRDKNNLDVQIDIKDKFHGFIFATLLDEYKIKLRFVLSRDLVCDNKGVVTFEC